MKKILLIAILFLAGQILFAQNYPRSMNFDTLEVFDDKVYVEYETYLDSFLISKTQAYLFPTICKIPRYKMFQNILKIEYYADSIVSHGETKNFREDGFSSYKKFSQGTLLNATYFNSEGEEITEREFDKDDNIKGPCGEVIGNYFIYGRKSKMK